MQTGRNKQCPCGSGKKYKKCCRVEEPTERQKWQAYVEWRKQNPLTEEEIHKARSALALLHLATDTLLERKKYNA